MPVLPFRSKPPRPEPIRFRVTLVKGTHVRLFEIIPNVGGTSGPRWQSWMRHDGHPLRALVTDDPLIVANLRREYEREIDALKADGWQ